MMQIDINVIQQVLGQKEFELIALRSELARLQKELEDLKRSIESKDNTLPFDKKEIN